MRRTFPRAAVGILLLPVCCFGTDETPRGQGLTEANQERLVLDDMRDVSDWYNGSPDETVISSSDRHVREGRPALLFANTVDHTRGEKNYPIGWPRTGKDLGRSGPSDWSGYDYFECWIYAETSRERLPGKPLGIGFYHSGQKRSSPFPLNVAKDAWSHVVIPVDRLLDAGDVRRLQFNISESDYRHGDRVDFYIDRPALVRYVEPAVARFELERKLMLTGDRVLRAQYQLAGYRQLDTTRVEFAIFRDANAPVATTGSTATRRGELTLSLPGTLAPGDYTARLCLRDAQGALIDRQDVPLRVIAGPFQES
ncbi:MAG: hypothetical protein KJ000_31200 [Pirellulaceae bacterium]|nr:hypothetical protein [Pirellulaceae bacterium]